MKLNDSSIAQHLKRIPQWKREEKLLIRRFEFESFPLAIQFVNQVAEVAERRQHHPFISIDYKHVTLRLTSWHAGDLTAEDFDEAAEIDGLYLPYRFTE